MRNSDPQTSRLLESLSALLGKRLELTEGESDETAAVVSRSVGSVARFAVRSLGQPLSDGERAAVRDMLDLFQRETKCSHECEALDQRNRLLERENIDLTMKNRALAEASSKDALTGLYTRWFVIDKIETEMNRAVRNGSPMAVLMLDIDHFKRVNDSYGHSVGDQVLQSMGSVLKDSCRVYDIPGRYGGEEFCLMLPDIKMDNTMIVAERIRNRVEKTTLNLKGTSVKVTTSIGVAGIENVPEDSLFSAASLIERADRALYAAKDQGRNRIETWSSALSARHNHTREH